MLRTDIIIVTVELRSPFIHYLTTPDDTIEIWRMYGSITIYAT